MFVFEDIMHYILSVSIYFVRYFIHNTLSLEKSLYVISPIMCDLCKLILYFIWMDIFLNWMSHDQALELSLLYISLKESSYALRWILFFFSSFGFTFFIRRSRIIMDIVCRCRSSLSVEKNCGKHGVGSKWWISWFIFVSRFTTIKILIYDQVSS